MEIIIRNATESDCKLILTMIKELATYHRNPGKVVIDEKVLLEDGFGETPCFFSVIAEVKEDNGVIKPVGFALCYDTYSTWVGKTFYVEDIYVREAYRKKGVGCKLMKRVTQYALQKGAKRMGWSALNWNTSSIEFYKKLGGEMSEEWRTFSFTKDAMDAFINSS